MLDLIDPKDFSGVVNKLLDKLPAVLKLYLMRETPKRIAVKTYINDIQNGNYPPLEKAALIYNSEKIIKEFSNQVDILQYAMPHIKDTSSTEEFDDDWLNEFFDNVKNVSNEQMQKIWGRILAEEVNTPGSVSLRLVDTVKKLTRNEAQCFTNAASLAIQFNHDYGLLSLFDVKRKFSQEDLFLLEECGLMSSEISTYTVPFGKREKKIIYYNENFVILGENLLQQVKFLLVSYYRFTKIGNQLLNIIDVPIDNKFAFEKASELQNDNKNIKFSIHKICSIYEDKIEYDKEPYQLF